jgi:hypothetical protein
MHFLILFMYYIITGSAYVFKKISGTWTFQSKFFAADGTINDIFGVGVAVYGTTAVIGAALNNNGKGSLYMYTIFPTGVYSLQQKIASPDAAGSAFGRVASIYGNTMVVGTNSGGHPTLENAGIEA